MDDADVSRYFPAPSESCPTFVDDTEWQPVVDGAAYLPALAELLGRAGPGDTVSIVGLELDPALDLHGHAPGERGYQPFGELLARLAADGVDVRIILAFRVLAASLPVAVLGGFRATGHHAETLRSWTLEPGGPPPLAGRVLLDHSGALLGSNHQKAVVARIGGELTAFVGGIDLVTDRFDAAPHDTLRLRGERWGWHDMAVRLRGRAAEQVWEALRLRWIEASTLPLRHYIPHRVRRTIVNPGRPVPPPDPTPPTAPIATPGTAVRVLRSTHWRKTESVLPARRIPWLVQPDTGYHEIFETLTHAIGAARRFVYIEDQYLGESAGRVREYELFPVLRAAAERGVKVILVGSGTRDPEDVGLHLRPINRAMNDDLQTKLIGPLDPAHRVNVAEFRIEHSTVHSKLVLIDDAFASIGSANMFSRSMAGIDCELTAAVVTTTSQVRDLRVDVWGEHLRAPLTSAVRGALADLDLALGMWRTEWSGAADRLLWRATDRPPGFEPAERVLRLVGP